jgi:tetratricopeptide (TPR) repeat protein
MLSSFADQDGALERAKAEGLPYALSTLSHALALTTLSSRFKEDEEALTLHRLGRLYEQQGAFEQAETSYRGSLEKQPNYSDAAEALERMLDKGTPLTIRCIKLLDQATRYLAQELTQREVLAVMPLALYVRRKKRREYRGKVYNFFGVQYQLAAAESQAYSQFFIKRAIDNFQTAIDLMPHWHRPQENLADSYWALGGGTRADSKETVTYDRALMEYDKALQKIHNEQEALEKSWILWVRSKKRQRLRETLEHSENRVRIDRAIVLLLSGQLSGRESFVREATESIWRLTGDTTLRLEDSQAEQTNANVALSASQKDPRALYNLACWYGLRYDAAWVCPVSPDCLPLGHGAPSHSSLFVL